MIGVADPKLSAEYAYTGGSANHSRLTKTTYPDGIEIDYDYGSVGDAGDALNRVEAIKEDTIVPVEYHCLGQNAPVITDCKDEPGVELTCFASGQSGEAGNEQRTTNNE